LSRENSGRRRHGEEEVAMLSVMRRHGKSREVSRGKEEMGCWRRRDAEVRALGFQGIQGTKDKERRALTHWAWVGKR
jgi:hypothetical protein